MAGAPDPKSRSLARGVRRYRRKVASPKQWQAIFAAKGGKCRLCGAFPVQYHHLVERDAPHFGDDVAENIVPLCFADHSLVTDGHKLALYRLEEALTGPERAYVVGKVGEDAYLRLFGVAAAGMTHACAPMPNATATVEPEVWTALRDLQRAVRAYALGLGNETIGWERLLAAERHARELIAREGRPS